MSLYSSGGLSTAGSTTLPVFALVGAAGLNARVLEIGVFNTTATAVALKLCQMTTAGTPGSATTIAKMNPQDTTAPVAVARNTYTVTATNTDLGYRCVLGNAIGSGFVWTFADYELYLLAATAGGVGCLVENGTGQALQWYIKWRE